MLIERLMKVALLGSEWVMYLLVLFSVLSISTMVERWLFFRKHRGDIDALRSELERRLGADDAAAAAKLLEASPSFEARIARKALLWVSGGADAIHDVVEFELSRVKKELERGLNLLGTLGNNAPFIGLFGTVIGVIIAFQALGDAGQNSSAMGGVMAAIAEALVATGVGLFVALPAVVAYNVIQKRIGEIETDAIALTKLITAHVKANPALGDTSDAARAATGRGRAVAESIGDVVQRDGGVEHDLGSTSREAQSAA